MKLVVFGPFKRLGGLLKDGSIVDLNLAYGSYLKDEGKPRPKAQVDSELPANLQDFIEAGAIALKAAAKTLAYAEKKRGDLTIKSDGVKIWAPLPNPGTMISNAGANFADHSAGSSAAREGKKATPEDVKNVIQAVKDGKHPMWGFWKLPRFVIGPDEPMIYPSRTTHLDYEGEVAVIISKKGKNITADKAMDYVIGYTCYNDWSVRDDVRTPLERWAFGKNFDTSCSLGPCIVTKDEIPDPYNLNIQLRVNGELRQNGSTSMMLRKFPEWIAHVSRNLTINPGDIFASGTCAGTAMDTSPRDVQGKVSTDRFLKVGDIVELKVEGIGSIKNKVTVER